MRGPDGASVPGSVFQGKAVEVELRFQSNTIAKGQIVGFAPPPDIAVRMAQAVK